MKRLILLALLVAFMGCGEPLVTADQEDSYTLEEDDGLAWVDAEPYGVMVGVEAYVPEAVFLGDDGEEMGKLSWEGGVFKFEGKAEESAKIFFDWLKENIDLECNQVKEKNHTSHKVDNRYDYY